MGLVAQIASWRGGHRFTPGPMLGTVDPIPTPTFPATHLGFQVQLALGADPSADPSTWVWTDVTRYVFQGPKIAIKRGRENEETQTAPSTCQLSLRNSDPSIPADPALDGLFTPRNANGPYFGYLRRNTPLRVDIDPGTGWVRRWTGFVPNWPPQSDVTGRFKVVRIQAAGILRRLGQARTPLKSSTMKAITSTADVVAYWPMEDGASASQFLSYFSDPAATPASGVTLAADSTALGSLPLPSSNGTGSVSFSVASAVSMTQWRTSFAFVIPTAPAGTVNLYEVATNGTVKRWRVTLTPGASFVTVSLTGYDSSGAAVAAAVTGTAFNASVYGHGFLAKIAVLPSSSVAGAIEYGIGLVTAVAGGAGSSSSAGTLAAASVGNVTGVTWLADSSLPQSAAGHLAVFANGGYVLATTATALEPTSGAFGIDGHITDTPSARFRRLSTEQGITSAVSVATSSILMGPQPIATYLDAAREAETVESGVLAEAANGVLTLYTRATYENQAVDLTLDFSAGHMQPPFVPAEDDQLTRNDVTASRSGGSSSHQYDQTGPLGISAVGLYDDSVTTNVYTDDLLPFQASYRVVHGTVDETRFPQVNINLARNPSLITAWLACDIGSRIQLTNLPSYLAIPTADQVLEGYTETLDPFMWTVELNLSPFSPHRIFRLASPTGDQDEFLGYLIPTTCVLAEDLDTTETGIDITTDTLWSTDPDDWSPAVKVTVEGEDMLVSAVSGASNPQTLTVTRSVNGVVKTHLTGAALAFATPGVLGL